LSRLVDKGTRKISLRNYPVTGTTFDEIRSSIQGNQHVPGGMAGYTSLEFKTETRETSIMGGIPLQSETVVVYAVGITLPLLVTGALSETVARGWNAYQQKLYSHEVNHARIYFAAVDRTLKVQDQSRFEAIIGEAKRLSQGYDNATQHGIREGCVLGGQFTAQDFGSWVDQAIRVLSTY
jgi:predicted secreted Zn-dependent protease